MKIGFGHSPYSPVLVPEKLSFSELCEYLRTTKSGEKREGYFIRGGNLIKQKTYETKKKTYTDIYPRKNKYLKTAELIVIDGDESNNGKKLISVRKLHKILKKLGYEHCIYSSFSHQKSKPKFRVVIPCLMLDSSYLKPSNIKLIDEVNKAGANIKLANEMNTWVQPWFFGTQDNPESFEIYTGKGKPFKAINDPVKEEQKTTEKKDNRNSVGEGDHYYEQIRSESQSLANRLKRTILKEPVEALLIIEAHAYGMCQRNGFDLGNYSHKENVLVSIADAVKKVQDENKNVSTPGVIPQLPVYSFKTPKPPRALPKLFTRIIENVSDSAKVDPALPLHCLMGVAALAFTHDHILTEKKGLIHKQTLSGAGVSSSGGRKTFVFKTIFKALEKITELQKKEYKEFIENQVPQNKLFESKIKSMLKIDKTDDGADPQELIKKASMVGQFQKYIKEIPSKPTLYEDDVTPEQFMRELESQGGRLSICGSDCRSVLAILMGRYANDGDSGVDPFLKIITGDTIKYSRRDARIEIKDPSGIMSILVQGDAALNFFGDVSMGNSGMLARLLPVYMNSMVGEQKEFTDDPIIDSTLIKDLADILYKIYSTKTKETSLSKGAEKLRMKFANKMQRKFSKGGLRNYVNEFNKVVTQACQAAWIFNSVCSENKEEISEKYMKMGIRYVEYRIKNAMLFYTSYEMSVNYKKAQKLILWMSSVVSHPSRSSYFDVDGFRLATLRNNLQGNRLRDDLDKLISILVEHGHITLSGNVCICNWTPETP